MTIKKKIMFLGAGFEQAIPIRLAKEMGLTVVALDANPNAIGLKDADVGICGDIKNVELVIKAARKYSVNGIMAHGVEVPVVVAAAAEELGLPGISPSIVERATHKLQRISRFKEAGVMCPNFKMAMTTEEAIWKGRDLNYPLVVKPVDSSGARGILRVNDDDELKEAITILKKYTKSSVFLMEEYVTGREFSTESVIYEGKIYTTGFADRNYDKNDLFSPYFVEDGHSVPSTLSIEKQNEVIEVVEQAILALDLYWGVAKGDVLINENGIYVFEMAARTSGGWFAAGTVPIATGVNILSPLIRMHVGLPVDEKEFLPSFERAACQRYLIPMKNGILQKITGVEEAFSMPGVKMALMFNPPVIGEAVHAATNHAERFGHIITEGEDLAQAVTRCESAIAKISIDVF